MMAGDDAQQYPYSMATIIYTSHLSDEGRFSSEILRCFVSMSPDNSKSSRIRIILLDSSRIGSQLFANVLKKDRFEIVYAGSCGLEAITVASRGLADVAIVSTTVEGCPGKGYDILRSLRSGCPRVRTISLIDHPEQEAVLEAFRSGARGLFCRNESLPALSKCIVAVHRGQLWASNAEMEYVLEAAVSPSSIRILDASGVQLLSPREQQVVACVSEGMTNREAAQRLGLSENTVKNYLFRIFDKLGISNRVELMMYAASQCTQPHANAPPHDPAKAFDDAAAMFRWCHEAAERSIFAPFTLAEKYRDGEVVLRDKIAAYMWLLIAKRLSSHIESRTQAALRDLSLEITEQQAVEAKRRASAWLKKHKSAEPPPEETAKDSVAA